MSYYFMMTLIFQEKKKAYAKTYKVEVINNEILSDLLYVSKNSIKILFYELLREKKGF